MAGMWKRMAVYLGLAEDEYDEYDDAPVERHIRNVDGEAAGLRHDDESQRGRCVGVTFRPYCP
jgi:hypothetical protein